MAAGSNNYWTQKARTSRVSRRRMIVASGSIGLGVVAMPLVGCGGDDDDAAAATSTVGAGAGATSPATSPATAPTQAPGGQRGGTLRIAYPEPQHFDPFTIGSHVVHRMRSFTNDKLVTFTQGPEVERGQRQLEGQIAESWENPDELSWTFKLRPGVMFHDREPVNGRELTVEDVVWSFERGMEPGAFQYSEFSDLITRVEATDAETLRVELSEPFAPFLQYVASDYSWIVAPESGEDGDFRSDASAVGTGPFMLSEYSPGVSARLQAHPDYFLPDQPLVDDIEWSFSSDPSALASGLLAGQFDRIFTVLEPEDYGRYEDAGIVLSDPELGGFNLIYLRADQEPFNDVRMRRAVSLAIQREAIVEGLFGGVGELSTAVPPWWPDWWVHPSELGDDSSNFLRYSPDESRQLMADAGYPDGIDLPYHSTLTSFGTRFNQLFEVTQQQLQAVGINGTPSLNDYAEFTSIVNNTKDAGFDGLAFSPRGFYPDIGGYLMNMHHPGQSRNYVRADDPELNPLLVAQQRAVDPEERWDIIFDIQRYLAENPYYVTMPCEASRSGFSTRIGHTASWGGPIGGYDLGHLISKYSISS